MITLTQLVTALQNTLLYEQKLVMYIDSSGRQIPVCSPAELYAQKDVTTKVEGMERFSKPIWEACNNYVKKYEHTGPVTCHAFLASKNAPSFPTHTDPDDVIIHCCEGTKTLYVEDTLVTLSAGQEVFIKANTLHKAVNTEYSLMLSFGLEKFLTDKFT
jgi:hypothetical protein